MLPPGDQLFIVLSNTGDTVDPVSATLVASLVQKTASEEPPADNKDSCAILAPLPQPGLTAASPNIISVLKESVSSPASFTWIVTLFIPAGVPVIVISPVTLSILNGSPAGWVVILYSKSFLFTGVVSPTSANVFALPFTESNKLFPVFKVVCQLKLVY